MEYIKEILKNNNPPIEDLLFCFERICERGDIALIKMDGARDTNHYTLLVLFPVEKELEMLRIDRSNLKEGMKEILEKYVALYEQID